MNEKLRKGMAVRHNGAALCPLTYGHDFNCSDRGGLARNTIGRISWEKQSCWTLAASPVTFTLPSCAQPSALPSVPFGPPRSSCDMVCFGVEAVVFAAGGCAPSPNLPYLPFCVAAIFRRESCRNN